MKNSFQKVKYNNNEYIVGETTKGEPFIFDSDIDTKDVIFYIIESGHVACSFESKNKYLQHFVMKKSLDSTFINHKNRIITDNRRVNLQYISHSEYNKIREKKKRLKNEYLESIGINVDDIPKFIWYVKPEVGKNGKGKKGDSWKIEIRGKYECKTITSVKYSTRCKFEAAKKHLKFLTLNNPELFLDHSINGELDKECELLKKEYIEIIRMAKYKYIEICNEKDYFKEELTGLDEKEISILKTDYSCLITKGRLFDNGINDNNNNNEKYNKQKLIDDFNKILKLDTNEVYKIDKIYQLKTINFLYDDDHYKNMMFNSIDISNIEISIEQVLTKEQRDIYNWIALHVSKLRLVQNKGKSIKLLVKDSVSDKILGLLHLCSDSYSLENRDSFIGWNTECKKAHLNDIMNIICCVPVQPFGFNFNGGKLLAQLAFSRQVFDIYYKKYNIPLIGLTTTSINGKSIQYDRLDCLDYIGLTKGYGNTHIPLELFDEAMEYLKQEYPKEYKNLEKSSSSKRDKINLLISKLNLNPAVSFHGEQRGIYFGYTFKNSKQLLNNEKKICLDDVNINELKDAKDIFDEWKDGRAIKRYYHLLSTGRIQTDDRLYSLDVLLKKKSNALSMKKSRERKRNELGDEEYKRIESEKRLARNQSKNFTSRKENDHFIILLKQNDEIVKFLNKPGYADIYRITNIITRKIYIGYATHITGETYSNGYLTRFETHKKTFTNYKKNNELGIENKFCSALYGSMEKHGIENFKIDCLLTCKTEYICDYEKYFIKEYNTISPNGYNITHGGDGNLGRKMTDKQKENLRIINTTPTSDYYKDNYIFNVTDPFILKRTDKDILLYIISQKANGITTANMKIDIKEKYNIIIPATEFSQLWLGKYKDRLPDEIIESKEYKEMETIKKKRCSQPQSDEHVLKKKQSCRTFTSEQFWTILKDKGTMSAPRYASKCIIGKNGKALGTGIIQKIWNGTIVPIETDEESISQWKKYIE